ncbi:cytochrome c-type heme lyase subunit nrfE [Vibrio sp. JCM 19236]|nr:cytochrome c-type heme lyase subunit nrfE [Vibrio sp. JCM 19236]
MMAVIAIFSWFTLLASNPFELNALVPLEGRDLNPMLQDIGLLSIHHFCMLVMLALPLSLRWQ